MTDRLPDLVVKGWKECEEKKPTIRKVVDPVTGVASFAEEVECIFSLVGRLSGETQFPLNEIRVLEEVSGFIYPKEVWDSGGKLLGKIGIRRHYGPLEVPNSADGTIKTNWNTIIELLPHENGYSRIGIRVCHPQNSSQPQNISDYEVTENKRSFKVVFSSYAYFHDYQFPENPDFKKEPKKRFYEFKTPPPGRIYFFRKGRLLPLQNRPVPEVTNPHQYEHVIMRLSQWERDKKTNLPLWLIESLKHYVELAEKGPAPVRRTFAPFSFDIGGLVIGRGGERLKVLFGYMPGGIGGDWNLKDTIRLSVQREKFRRNAAENDLKIDSFRSEFSPRAILDIRHRAWETFLHETRHAYQNHLKKVYDKKPQDDDGLIARELLATQEKVEGFGRVECIIDPEDGRVNPGICGGKNWDWNDVGDGFLVDPDLEAGEINLLPGNEFDVKEWDRYIWDDVESAIEMDAYLFGYFFNNNKPAVKPPNNKPSGSSGNEQPIPPPPVQPPPPVPKPELPAPEVFLSKPLAMSPNSSWVSGRVTNPPKEPYKIQVLLNGQNCVKCVENYSPPGFAVHFYRMYKRCEKITGIVKTETTKKVKVRLISEEGKQGPWKEFELVFNGLDEMPKPIGEWNCRW
jgi:hypothetical protein